MIGSFLWEMVTQKHVHQDVVLLCCRDYFGVVIIDEAHHSAAHTYRSVQEYFATAAQVKGGSICNTRVWGPRVGLCLRSCLAFSLDAAVIGCSKGGVACSRTGAGVMLRGNFSRKGDKIKTTREGK